MKAKDVLNIWTGWDSPDIFKVRVSGPDGIAAEDRLIEYGISIAPAGIRATLTKGAKDNYAARQKLIDLVLRLDISTVPR